MAELSDSLGRTINYVRISITDRCNFRCTYCMPPTGVSLVKHNKILRFEDISRLCAVLIEMGVRKIRFTGGEPLVRKGFPDFLTHLRREHPHLRIALTTNAFLLGESLKQIMSVGLDSLNISLDTLDPVKFRKITGQDVFQKVLSNIKQASSMGLAPIKINTVLIRGFNDSEVNNLLTFSKEIGAQLRLIEFMPLGDDVWSADSYISSEEILELLNAQGCWEKITQNSNNTAGPAVYYRDQLMGHQIGLISAVSDHFCQSCNRLRVSATGNLRTCLFSNNEVALRDLLQSGNAEQLKKIILSTVLQKPRCWHDIRDGISTMSSIGG